MALKGARCDLSGAGSAEEVVELLRAVSSNDTGSIVGVEWDESRWSDQSFPTRRQLDAISSKIPIMARRICCHVAVANSALLGALGTHGSHVNLATGEISEAAVVAATRLTYPSAGQIAAGMARAVGELHALGITAIHDIIEENNFGAYVEGLSAISAPLRIDGLFHVDAHRFDQVADKAACLGEYFRPMGIKIYADGSIGGRTAALHQPYPGTDGRGEILVDRSALRRALQDCSAAGIVCAVHAIGDRTLRMVLEEMARIDGGGGLFRIEHAEIIGDVEFEMLRDSGVFLVMQPNFVRNWAGEGGLYERRLGRERWLRNNPFRTLANSGVEYVFSSDGMPAGPLFGIKGALQHPNPRERIDPVSALARYTAGPCRLGRHRRLAGHIEPDQDADFAILSGNPILADPDTIKVTGTVVAGTVVWGDPAT